MMTNICFQCKHFKSTMINSLGTIVHKCKKYNEYIDPELFWEYPECKDFVKHDIILEEENNMNELELLDIFIIRLKFLTAIGDAWVDSTGYYHPLIERDKCDSDIGIEFKNPTLYVNIVAKKDSSEDKIYRELVQEIIIQFKKGNGSKYSNLQYKIFNLEEFGEYLHNKPDYLTFEEYKNLIRYDKLIIDEYRRKGITDLSNRFWGIFDDDENM